MIASIRELRLAIRSLIRSPGFTVIVVLTLALALGANIMMLGLVDAVVLRPLPFAESERLMMLWDTNAEKGIDKYRTTGFNYRNWREQTEVFEQLAVLRYSSFTLTGGGEPVRIVGARVTGDFFNMLGIAPLYGRVFSPDEFEPDGNSVIVLSHSLWNRHFSADPDAVGSKVILDGSPYTVVGVMPAQLFPYQATPSGEVVFGAEGNHYWIPITAVPDNANSHVLGVLAKLEKGVSQATAQTQMTSIGERLAVQFPDSNAGYSVTVVPLIEEAVGDVKTALWTLTGAVIFVLLIACVNISNLVLVRATSRSKELALRLALGASRDRLWGQFLAEALVLVMSGTLLGLALANWGLRALPKLGVQKVPRLAEASLDLRMLGMAALLCLLCGLVVALVPALQIGRRDLESKLRQGGRESSGGSSVLHRALVGVEMMLVVVLVVGSGLLISSIVRLQAVDPGFDSAQILSAEIQQHADNLEDMADLVGFYDQLLHQVRGAPGVDAAVLAYDHPLVSHWSQSFGIENAPAPPQGQSREALFRTVTPGYFDILGIDLRSGRDFTEGDDNAAPGVAIVNEAFIDRFFEGRESLGRRLEIYTTQWLWGEDIPTSFGIVGVVENVRFAGLEASAEPAFYLPYRQTPHLEMRLLVSSQADVRSLLPIVRSQLRDIDPRVPIVSTATLDEVIEESLARPQFNMLLLSAFAAFSLLLAMMGLWGVLSNTVSQRKHEIGIRMAMGAGRREVFTWILRYGLTPILAGMAAGIVATLALGRILAGLLYEVSVTDPVIYGLTLILLLLTSVLACLSPAWKASRTDPMIVLRGE